MRLVIMLNVIETPPAGMYCLDNTCCAAHTIVAGAWVPSAARATYRFKGDGAASIGTPHG
jgi:hypothetical protein